MTNTPRKKILFLITKSNWPETVWDTVSVLPPQFVAFHFNLYGRNA
jgi:hypothetical protein